MSGPRTWTYSVVAVLLGALLVSGCGSGARVDRAVDRAAVVPAATPLGADARACVGVEGVIGHITADTARWSPAQQPFDPVIARRLSGQSRVLAAQATIASGRDVVRAVRATAVAFDGVARAMTTKRLPQFRRAIARSRTAYAVLKRVCSFQ